MSVIPSLPAADHVILDVDTPCRRCGYNLRGLSTDGLCPECATPAGLSALGDLLRFSDPEWLDRFLYRGVRLIIWGVVVLILGTIAGGLVAVAVGVPGLAHLPALAGHVLMLVGSWLMTAPDPSGIGEDRYGMFRKTIRIGVVVAASNSLLDLANTFAPDPMQVVIRIAAYGAVVFGIVAFIATMQYLRRLSQRIPDDKLAARAHFLTYAFPIPYVLLLAGTLAGVRLAAILALPVLVFGIMYLLLIERFGKRVKEQVQLARQTWNAGGTRLPV